MMPTNRWTGFGGPSVVRRLVGRSCGVAVRRWRELLRPAVVAFFGVKNAVSPEEGTRPSQWTTGSFFRQEP